MCVCEGGRSPENFVLTIVVVSAWKWVISLRDKIGAWGLFRKWIDHDKVSYCRWCELMKSAPMIKSLILLQTQTLCTTIFPKIVKVIGKTPYKSRELPLASLRPGLFAVFSVMGIPCGKMWKKWSVLMQVRDAPVSYKKFCSELLIVTLILGRKLSLLKLAMSESKKLIYWGDWVIWTIIIFLIWLNSTSERSH